VVRKPQSRDFRLKVGPYLRGKLFMRAQTSSKNEVYAWQYRCRFSGDSNEPSKILAKRELSRHKDYGKTIINLAAQQNAIALAADSMASREIDPVLQEVYFGRRDAQLLGYEVPARGCSCGIEYVWASAPQETPRLLRAPEHLMTPISGNCIMAPAYEANTGTL
jgi:hypothetical protein